MNMSSSYCAFSFSPCIYFCFLVSLSWDISSGVSHNCCFNSLGSRRSSRMSRNRGFSSHLIIECESADFFFLAVCSASSSSLVLSSSKCLGTFLGATYFWAVLSFSIGSSSSSLPSSDSSSLLARRSGLALNLLGSSELGSRSSNSSRSSKSSRSSRSSRSNRSGRGRRSIRSSKSRSNSLSST